MPYYGEVPLVIRSLTSQRRSELYRSSVRRHFEPGAILFLAGQEPTGILLVESGIVRSVARLSDGEETIVGLARRGDLLGAVPAFSSERHHLDAIAQTEVCVRAFPRDRFITAATRHPVTARCSLYGLAREARRATRSMVEAATVDASGRIAGRLLELADAIGVVRAGALYLEMPFTQTDLGKMAATTREHTCRTLRTLRDAGVLDYDGPQLRIHRPDVLEKLRCGERAAVPSPSASEAGSRRSLSRSGT